MIDKESSPARYWRNEIAGCPDTYSDEEVYKGCCVLRDSQKLKELSELDRFARAVLLFTFGELDAAKLVLEFMPKQLPGEPRKRYLVMALAVRDILPLPKNLHPLREEDHAQIVAWLDANQGKLVWNEERGRFLFSESNGEDPTCAS